LIGKGLALDSLQRNIEAIRCYDKALEIEPNNARARHYRALHNVIHDNTDIG
jgi:hypothetical protein